MARVKRGVTTRAKHKNILEQAKGYRGRRGNVFRVAKQAVMRAGQYAIAIAAIASACSGRCGSPGSMRRCVNRV